jgi:hypothetical protein
MNETKIPGRFAGVDRRVANRDPNQPAQTGNWIGHGEKAHGRHAAITMNLYSWHSYKNWAEKVRNDWDEKDRKR